MDFVNRKTAITTSVIGVLLGMGGIFNHGLFEILQGHTPTPGYSIEAIGPQHRFWLHGTEGAFTVIPDFLLTGISVIVIGLAVNNAVNPLSESVFAVGWKLVRLGRSTS